MVKQRKRIDGVGPLNKDQKRERDARAQHWMNQRKIERVAEGAYRHGWSHFTAGLVTALIDTGDVKLDDDGELVLILEDDGEYRIHGYNVKTDTYLVRKILTYKEEQDVSA